MAQFEEACSYVSRINVEGFWWFRFTSGMMSIRHLPMGYLQHYPESDRKADSVAILRKQTLYRFRRVL